MEKHEDAHDLALGHFRGALGRLAQNEALGRFIEVLAELIG